MRNGADVALQSLRKSLRLAHQLHVDRLAWSLDL